MNAAEWGHSDVCGLLLEKGADPNVQDKEGVRSVAWCCACVGVPLVCGE